MKITDPQSGKSYFSKRRHRHDADRTPRSPTFSCYKRFPLLSRDRSRRWFVEALSEARARWPVDLWAYVIMPEHVHLLVAPREVVEIGRFVGAVKEQVSRTAISWWKPTRRSGSPESPCGKAKRLVAHSGSPAVDSTETLIRTER